MCEGALREVGLTNTKKADYWPRPGKKTFDLPRSSLFPESGLTTFALVECAAAALPSNHSTMGCLRFPLRPQHSHAFPFRNRRGPRLHPKALSLGVSRARGREKQGGVLVRLGREGECGLNSDRRDSLEEHQFRMLLCKLSVSSACFERKKIARPKRLFYLFSWKEMASNRSSCWQTVRVNHRVGAMLLKVKPSPYHHRPLEVRRSVEADEAVRSSAS